MIFFDVFLGPPKIGRFLMHKLLRYLNGLWIKGLRDLLIGNMYMREEIIIPDQRSKTFFALPFHDLLEAP